VDPDERSLHDPAAASRESRLQGLAKALGLKLPPFDGPLDAFELGEDRRPGDPVYLGGYLHATHPEAIDRGNLGERDHSLDSATVIIDDLEHPAIETVAVEGIWCLAVRDELLSSAPYFTVWDTKSRIRTWLVLPQPPMMIGLGHLWLPRVKPPPGPDSTS
jgi:hypothetical protein